MSASLFTVARACLKTKKSTNVPQATDRYKGKSGDPEWAAKLSFCGPSSHSVFEENQPFSFWMPSSMRRRVSSLPRM